MTIINHYYDSSLCKLDKNDVNRVNWEDFVIYVIIRAFEIHYSEPKIILKIYK